MGNGTTEVIGDSQHTPVQVNNLSDVVAISAGEWHSLALKSDGTVWTWGYLIKGYGTGETRSTPVQVNNLSDVTAIFAGESGGNFALKSDGTTWAWGFLSYGLLGDGTTTTRSTPVQAKNLSDVVAISAGGYHSLALKSDGTAWAWGYNYSGYLGDGTTEDRSIPVQVNNLSDVVAISAGDWHSLALKSDGTVWAWGDNGYGQLGDGTTTDSSTPIQVSDLSGIISIASRSSNILSLKSDGTVLEWGYYLLPAENNYRDVDVNESFSDPYRGVKVGLIEKTGNDSDSKVKLKVTLSDININPEGVLNFSKSSINTTSSLSVTITNNTNEQIDIGSLSISGRNSKLFNIVSDECSNRNLEQGESCNVTISFTPDSKGEKFGILTVPNSDSIRPQATISLYGEGSETTTEEEDLLGKYAPILYMHEKERFYPTNVEVMLENSELYISDSNIPVYLKDGLTLENLIKYCNEDTYYLKLKKESKKKLKDKKRWKKSITVYGREFAYSGKNVLQYWFFYVYNDWGGTTKGGNRHEGDWEMIQIILGKDEQGNVNPERITFSFHHGGESFVWDEKDKNGKEKVAKSKDGNRPLVYITLGGHGCWNTPGDHKWYQERALDCWECTDETNNEGDVLYPKTMSKSEINEIESSAKKYSYAIEDVTDWKEEDNDWIYWKGYWGKQQFAKKLKNFGLSGPASPPYIDYINEVEEGEKSQEGRWYKPIEWADNPKPSSYELCNSDNSKVVVNYLNSNSNKDSEYCNWTSDLSCDNVCSNLRIIYSGKDLLFNVYSLDGEEVNLKISRHTREGEVYEVEFDGLEIPKSGKASFTFSAEQNPSFEMRIDHDRDGFFDSHRLPDFLEVK